MMIIAVKIIANSSPVNFRAIISLSYRVAQLDAGRLKVKVRDRD